MIGFLPGGSRLAALFGELVVTGPVPPRRGRDWLLAGLAIALTAAEVVIEHQLPLTRLGIGMVVASFVPIRRQYPFPAVMIALAGHVVLELIARQVGENGNDTVGQQLASALSLYALCRWGRPYRVLAGSVLVVVVMVFTELVIEHNNGPDDLASIVPWALLPLFALSMRYRSVMVDQQEDRIRMGERQALARDVHDSVAHHVSAIAVQAQAARYVAAADPESAAAAMARVEAEASIAIDELRRLVGVLRTGENGDGPLGRAPAPSSLRSLLDHESSPPVVLSGEHDLTQLPPPVATGIYRIAQEAVTNARRHSRGATAIEVGLRVGHRRVCLEVSDDGAVQPKRTSGYGLTGMSERAEVLGGSVTYGPAPDLGWQVVAVFPVR